MRGVVGVLGAVALSGCGPLASLVEVLERDARAPNVLIPEVVVTGMGEGQLYTARLARVALVADHTGEGIWGGLPLGPYFAQQRHGFAVSLTDVSIREDGRWIAASGEEYLSNNTEEKVYIWRADVQAAQVSTTDNVVQGHAENFCDFASLYAQEVAAILVDAPAYDPSAPVQVESVSNSGGPQGIFELWFAGWSAAGGPVLAVRYAQSLQITQAGVVPEGWTSFETEFDTYYLTYGPPILGRVSVSAPVGCGFEDPSVAEPASLLDVALTSPRRGATGLAVAGQDVANYLDPSQAFVLRHVAGPISAARLLQD